MSDNEDDTLTDAVGDTVYSKSWIIQCLLKLIKFVEVEPDLSTQSECTDVPSASDNLDEIEEQLCLLWDMSSNEGVQQFFIGHNAHQIFVNCLFKTNSPRIAEISIGILGNIVHNKDINGLVSNDSFFCDNLFSLVESNDIPFLIQLIRFLNTVICHNKDRWMGLIEDHATLFFSKLQYLCLNCLNVELLQSTLQMVNHLLYLNSNLGKLWLQENCQNGCISSLCQACFQIISSIENDLECDNIDRLDSTVCTQQSFYHFWFILQMLIDLDWNLIKHDLLDNVNELKELFVKFKHFVDSSENSLSSYGAACVVFSTLFGLCQNDQLLDQQEIEIIMSLRHNMRAEQWIAQTHTKVVQLCRDQLEDSDRRHIIEIVMNNSMEFSAALPLNNI